MGEVKWITEPYQVARHIRNHLLHEHLEAHGCGTGDTTSPTYVGGFFHCPEANRLWEMLAPEDRVALA